MLHPFRIFVSCLALAGLLLAQNPPADVVARLDNNGTWRAVQSRNGTLCSRDLFSYGFQLCEHGVFLERLDELFSMAAAMQDRDRKSPHFGNLHWSLKDGVVLDSNAVEFCMETGALIWYKHRDKLTPAQKKALMELFEYSIAGCLNHRVSSGYTNIAIMNCQNLIILGEMLERPEVLAEGRKRLEQFMFHTALYGITEYSSPTYSGVDLGCLQILWQFTRTPEVKSLVDKLLRLFWSELAASAFAPAGRLGGTHSRDYDYLRGFGVVDSFLHETGMVRPLNNFNVTEPVCWSNSTWRPSADIRALASLTPRFVEQRWGESPFQNRMFWAGKHIALGVSGACYHNMDIPMAVNFDSAERIPRGYFIADGRRDPYGKKVIPEGSGHLKTLHLKPFWGGAQNRRDALGLVVYRNQDINATNPTLESHFVLPVDVDEILLDDEHIVCQKGQPFVKMVKPGQALFLRSGAGACGIRIPWSRDSLGQNAPVALVWDDNVFGALRLTVAHHDYWGLAHKADLLPGAAFWIRVCDEAAKPEAFASFRTAFRKAKAEVQADAQSIAIGTQGLDGALRLKTTAPFASLMETVPKPSCAILAVNGRDLGREILADTPGLAEYLANLEQQKRDIRKNEIIVKVGVPVVWEAESGAVVSKMEIAADKNASGGKYVWTPGEVGARGGGPGSVFWQINVLSEGDFYLWARVSTPTPDDDSFMLAIENAEGIPIQPEVAWALETSGGPWVWSAYLNRAPVRFHLAKGRYTIRLNTREDGTKVDQMALTPTPEEP